MRFIHSLPISIATQINTFDANPHTQTFYASWGQEYHIDATANSVVVYVSEPLTTNAGEIITVNRVDGNSSNDVLIVLERSFFSNLSFNDCDTLSLKVGSTTEIRSTGTQTHIKTFDGISFLARTWQPTISNLGSTVKKYFNAKNINGLGNGNAGLVDGTTFQIWTELSGNNANVTQDNPVERPTYRATGIAGNPAVENTVNQGYMAGGGYGSDNYTVLAFGRTGPSLTNHERIFGGEVSGGNLSIRQHTTAFNWVHTGVVDMASANTLPTVNTTYLRTLTFDDTPTTNNVVYRYNGQPDGTQSYSGDINPSPVTFQLFREGTFNSNAGTRLGIFVLCDSVLSQSNIDKLEGFAAWEYRVENTLPVSHPYRYHPPTVPLRGF